MKLILTINSVTDNNAVLDSGNEWLRGLAEAEVIEDINDQGWKWQEVT